MFKNIIIIGSGAITYMTVRKITKFNKETWYNALIQLLAYSLIDMITAYFCLSPIGRISLITLENGTRDLKYGNTAIVFSIVIAIVWGIVFSFIKKEVDINMEIDKNE